MIQILPDFLEEKTLLQYYGDQMGIIVDPTPKCHPELAGEGIEYAWGCAKGSYRRLPIKEKKSKQNFKKSVKKVLLEEVLSTNRIRMFSRRARQYTLAYFCINKERERETGEEKKKEGELTVPADLTVADRSKTKTDDNRPKKRTELTNQIIERIVKGYKSHRDASDFDYGFTNGVVSRMASSNQQLCLT